MLKLQIHVSYLLCLPAVGGLDYLSPKHAPSYFEAALRVGKLSGTQPSLFPHYRLDFPNLTDTSDELAFFPAINVTYERRLELVGEILNLSRE